MTAERYSQRRRLSVAAAAVAESSGRLYCRRSIPKRLHTLRYIANWLWMGDGCRSGRDGEDSSVHVDIGRMAIVHV